MKTYVVQLENRQHQSPQHSCVLDCVGADCCERSDIEIK